MGIYKIKSPLFFIKCRARESNIWLDFFLVISDWCAKLYQHYWYNHYYNYGWLKVVGAGSRLDLHSYLNDQTSSVRVRPGCTLKLFKHKNCDWLLRSFTYDVNAFTAYNGNFNDQASSLTCTCHWKNVQWIKIVALTWMTAVYVWPLPLSETINCMHNYCDNTVLQLNKWCIIYQPLFIFFFELV